MVPFMHKNSKSLNFQKQFLPLLILLGMHMTVTRWEEAGRAALSCGARVSDSGTLVSPVSTAQYPLDAGMVRTHHI